MRAFALRFWVPVVLLAIVTTIVQQFYVVRSEAITPGALVELPFASTTHLLTFLGLRKGKWADTVFSDTLNYSAAPIQAYYVNPSRIIYLAGDWYDGTSDPRYGCRIDPCLFVASANRFQAFAKLRALRDQTFFRRASFDFSVRGVRSAVDVFRFDLRGTDANLTANTQMISQVRESVLNHWPRAPLPGDPIYNVTPPTALKNHLIFVSGTAGVIHGLLFAGNIGLYGVESDPFFNDGMMSAVGRRLLFRTIAPGRKVRMVLSISTSFSGPTKDKLPPAAVVGKSRKPLQLVGHGSARVFSAVVEPRSIQGMRFVGLDLGRDPSTVPQPPRSGLLKIYGHNITLDGRLTTAWARDISLIDDGSYERMRPPSSVSRFPSDLGNPALEYSGVYEDGWISDRAYVVLQPRTPRAVLSIRALVPLIADPSYRARVCVRVDAGTPACKIQAPGIFSYERAAFSTKRHTVELSIAPPQSSRGPDNRRLGARLDFVGFRE